jgi:prepilin-type N-terminal cleavage/methylation domain-containing protein
MRAHRGFTLIEMMVVVVIIAVMAAMAVSGLRAAKRNASVQSAAFELALRFGGLRTRALRDQRDLVAILLDAEDVQACAHGDSSKCGMFRLIRTDAGFALNGFPLLVAAELDRETLPFGIRFHRAADGRAAPRPYNAIRMFDPELVGNCGGRDCIGIRFSGDGTVSPEYPAGVPGNPKLGVAFALGSELTAETTGTDQRGIVVTFPAGIVKGFPTSQ